MPAFAHRCVPPAIDITLFRGIAAHYDAAPHHQREMPEHRCGTCGRTAPTRINFLWPLVVPFLSAPCSGAQLRELILLSAIFYGTAPILMIGAGSSTGRRAAKSGWRVVKNVTG